MARRSCHGCWHDGQRYRVDHMLTATAADEAFGGVMERDQERSGFQLRNRFKRSRCAGPFQISSNRNALESDLYDWVAEVVRHTKQPPENGLHAETILMATAQDSIDILMQAMPMALGGS